MQRVDRLYIQVRRAYGVFEKQVNTAFIEPIEGGGWRSITDLWDGKEGSYNKAEDRVISDHSTKEEAIEAVEALEEVHAPHGNYRPLFKEAVIFINDPTLWE